MKIKLEKEKIEKLTNDKKITEKNNENPKKINFLKIFTVVLLTLLTLAIVVEIILIIVYNDKINKTKDDIENIPDASISTKFTENISYENIEYNPSNNLIIWFS